MDKEIIRERLKRTILCIERGDLLGDAIRESYIRDDPNTHVETFHVIYQALIEAIRLPPAKDKSIYPDDRNVSEWAEGKTVEDIVHALHQAIWIIKETNISERFEERKDEQNINMGSYRE